LCNEGCYQEFWRLFEKVSRSFLKFGDGCWNIRPRLSQEIWSKESLLTHDLHRELIATRIRVMEIDPGQVETEFSVVRFYGDKAKADAVYA
jgi:hypothetical protein